MNIKFRRASNPYHFEAETKNGCITYTDADVSSGGTGKAPTPMEMLLVGLGGCSGIDMVNILKKQKQNLRDIEIEINAEKKKEYTYSVHSRINLHFILYGNLEKLKVEKALKLTFEKYCSVAMALKKGSEIHYTFEIKQ